MTRRLAWLALTAALLGCKSAAAPGTDPFFGRTTVPPPATGAAATPGFAQPGALQPGPAPTTSTNGPLAGTAPNWGTPAGSPSSGGSPYAYGLPYGSAGGGSPASPSGSPQPSTNGNTASWPWVPPAGSAAASSSAANGNTPWGGPGATSSAPNWGRTGQPASTGNTWNGNSWTQTPAGRYGPTQPTAPPTSQPNASTGPGPSSGPGASFGSGASPSGAWPQGNPGARSSSPGTNPWPGGLTPYSPPANGMRGASAAPPYGQNNAGAMSAPVWNPNATSADVRQGPWPAQQAASTPARPLGSFVGAPAEGQNDPSPTSPGVSGRPVTNDPASVVLSREPIMRTISPPPRDAIRSPGAPADALNPGIGASAATASSQAPVSTGAAARGTPARTNILDLPDVDGSPSAPRSGANESNYRSAATAPAYGAAVGPRASGEATTGAGGGAASAANGSVSNAQAAASGSGNSPTSTGQQPSFKADAPYGYDTNYLWLRGRLENNGSPSTWRVAYVPPYAPADQFGGVLPVANPTAMTGYSPGQQVEVRGRLVRVWSRGILTHAFYVTEVQRIDSQ